MAFFRKDIEGGSGRRRALEEDAGSAGIDPRLNPRAPSPAPIYARRFSKIDASDNPVLVNAIQYHAKRAHVVRFVSLTRRAALQQAREEHWAMIDALRSGERERLITLCRDHLGPSRDIYIETYGRTEP